jgi:hypothetical protein
LKSDVPVGPEPARANLLWTVGCFAGLTAAVVAASISVRLLRHPPPPPAMVTAKSEVQAFLGPLAGGAWFGSWHVVHVDSAPRDHLTLDLSNRAGDRVAIDVLARSPSGPAPIAETATFALYVRAGRPGEITPPAAIEAAQALAAALRERETTGAPAPTLRDMGAPAARE